MHMLTKPQAFYDERHKTVLGYQNPMYLAQARRKVPSLYDGHTILRNHDTMYLPDTEETLALAEESRLKMEAKQNDPSLKEHKVNLKPIDYVALNKLSEHFVTHFVPQKQLSAEQAFWLPVSQPVTEKPPVPSVLVFQKDIPCELPKISINVVLHANNLPSVNLVLVSLKKDNDHLIKLLISQDLVHTQMNMLATLHDYKFMKQSYLDEYEENLKLKTELAKKNDWEFITINNLEAQLKAKDVSISRLRDHINTLKGKSVSENGPRVRSSVEASGSKFKDNTKNDRITQTSSSNKKPNKVEDQTRIAKSRSNKSNRVSKPVCNANVKHYVLNANSELICATCNECMFDAIHDSCVRDYVNAVNGHAKSQSVKPKTVAPKKPLPTKAEKATLLESRKLGILKDTTNLVRPGSKSKKVVQIVLWCLDSGCSKHMTRQRSQLINFVSKFLGTVRFGNDQTAKIMGYDLEMAFRKHTCYVRNLDGKDLITRSRDTNLYTISMDYMLRSSPICLLSKASKTKSWLWHRLLSHLNFNTINNLAKHGLSRGLPKLKFEKDHLRSACSLGKSKKTSHKPKADDTNQEKLSLLHMDLYGPMRVDSINGKKYILVIVDDYSRFTWVKFLRSKDEALEAIIKCLK
ncbi:retrovirus-related pol polyprotein from transposon TNT 1-94 [Tanacetum coccineum]